MTASKVETQASTAQDAPQQSRLSILWPLLASLAVALVILSLPRLPLGSDDDSSWSAVLAHAHVKGMQFGSDLVFTYGPLGFLITPYQCPQAPGLRLFSDIGISWLSALGICLLAWRLPGFWRWLLMGAFALFAADSDPRVELLLNVGLLTWGLLCLIGTRRRRITAAIILVGLSVFGALAKATFLFIGPMAVVAVAAVWVLRGQLILAAALPVSLGVGVVLTWLGLGQRLANLGPFLHQSLLLASGYSAAMQFENFPTLLWRAGGVLAVTLPAIALGTFAGKRRSVWSGATLFFWLCGWLFLVWKLGFSRGGRDHAEVFFGFAAVLVLALQVFMETGRQPLLWVRSLGILCCLLSLFAWQWMFSGQLLTCLIHPYNLAREHLYALTHPRTVRVRQEEMQASEAALAELPRVRRRIGQDTVDVFGYNQAYALFNNLNYDPRPLFQSYATYSEPLASLNEQFYFSASAPRYVLFRLYPMDDRFPPLEDAKLFRLYPMDDRFPPLEDAKLFRDLLVNYAPVDAEGPFLLLQSTNSNLPPLKLLREAKVRLGQPIDLSHYEDTDLWLEIDVQPTGAGQARTLLYQAPYLHLGVWCRAGDRLRLAKFRAPAAMLRSGFVASPLLLENQDVLDLYTHGPITRPAGYSVEVEPAQRRYWQDTVGFKLYKIEDRLGRNSPRELKRLLQYPGFEIAPAAVVARTNAVVQIRGHQALYLPPGSYMRFVVPPAAKTVHGSLGFALAAYSFGGQTEGAEFRIEEEFPDGRMQLLKSRILRPLTNPDDRGLQTFSLDCPGEGPRDLLFRILPLAGQPSPWDLTCWAEIGFK